MKIVKFVPEPTPPPEPTFILTLSLDEMRALVHLTGHGDDAANLHFCRLMAALTASLGESYASAKYGYDRNACFRNV